MLNKVGNLKKKDKKKTLTIIKIWKKNKNNFLFYQILHFQMVMQVHKDFLKILPKDV